MPSQNESASNIKTYMHITYLLKSNRLLYTHQVCGCDIVYTVVLLVRIWTENISILTCVIYLWMLYAADLMGILRQQWDNVSLFHKHSANKKKYRWHKRTQTANFECGPHLHFLLCPVDPTVSLQLPPSIDPSGTVTSLPPKCHSSGFLPGRRVALHSIGRDLPGGLPCPRRFFFLPRSHFFPPAFPLPNASQNRTRRRPHQNSLISPRTINRALFSFPSGRHLVDGLTLNRLWRAPSCQTHAASRRISF